MAYTRLALVLGNTLFPDHSLLQPDEHTLFFMAEDAGLCTHYKYHKQKLVLFLSAMRQHADELRQGYSLKYWELNSSNQNLTYEEKLNKTIEEYQSIDTVVTYDIEDHFFEKRIKDWCKKNNLKLEIVDSPGFLTTKKQFEEYLSEVKKPFMHTFYQRQRKRLDMLMTADGEPINGKWSFDEENRKPLPKSIAIPEITQSKVSRDDEEVIHLVNDLFPEHPGSTEHFNWSTNRRSALYRVNKFIEERLTDFGPYEDAISKDEAFLFHSVLSPYINLGLITPKEVLDKVLGHYEKHKTHYPSVEGFGRQVAGWREFMRGIYHNFDLSKNHFGHNRKMKDCWYEGTTGIPPLDDSILKAQKFGYTHHIERLMVLGNIMLMTGLHPEEVYKWFMEMYVDSSDWVMEPNVYGMSQFAEGGIFATKPYISGSNYIRKMSNYPKGPWCDVVDGLYWRFVSVNRETFAANPRMKMILGTLDKMKQEKKQYLFDRAEKWIGEVSEE